MRPGGKREVGEGEGKRETKEVSAREDPAQHPNSSTRKIYERKLVQLLASSPCESVMKRPRRLPGSEDSDDSEDPSVNIILKGNIKFSKNKGKEGKKVRCKTKSEEQASVCHRLQPMRHRLQPMLREQLPRPVS
ncbi:LEM domain-containing protein 1 isoform X3 [Rattus norvegicus]|uniref:LEM domain-containing protein 1 isoform X3 n=1 Tax=Rattus norvegicus TaxID=10116 RepID=UPI002FD7D7DC